MRSTRVAGPFDLARLAVAPLIDPFSALDRLPFRAHVEQVDEEVVGQRSRPLGEHAVLGAAGIGAKDTQAADQNRESQARSASATARGRPGLLGLEHLLAAGVIAEPVSGRLERLERLDVGFILRSVHAARREGNLHVLAGVLRRLLDRRAAAENDQVGERDLLAAQRRSVEAFWISSSFPEPWPSCGRLVDVPILLRLEPNARAVSAAALVAAAEDRGRRPGGRDQLGTDRPEARIFVLRSAMSLSPTKGWFTAGIGSCQISVSFGTSGPR